ncbi:MAG TPA: hypothetical protein VI168_13645 [Croceibacterium sp.]
MDGRKSAQRGQTRLARRRLRWFALPAAFLAPDTALAAGGPHVIDDSEVETAGDCHLETWAMGSSGDQWLANAGLGCTPEAVPMLELGAMVTHAWSPGADETLLGMASKLNLRPADTGLGLAVAGALAYGTDRSRFEAASLIAAVTVPAGERLRVNLNAGWVWTEAGAGHELFGGAQAEWAVGSGVTLMAEGFGRDHGNAGAQAGVRWTTGGGRVDLDLLAGRFHDGATPTSVTLGLTVRW